MRIILVVAVFVLGACSNDAEDARDPIGESYHEALDEAEEVEAIVEDHAETTRKELEKAEGN